VRYHIIMDLMAVVKNSAIDLLLWSRHPLYDCLFNLKFYSPSIRIVERRCTEKNLAKKREQVGKFGRFLRLRLIHFVICSIYIIFIPNFSE